MHGDVVAFLAPVTRLSSAIYRGSAIPFITIDVALAPNDTDNMTACRSRLGDARSLRFPHKWAQKPVINGVVGPLKGWFFDSSCPFIHHFITGVIMLII